MPKNSCIYLFFAVYLFIYICRKEKEKVVPKNAVKAVKTPTTPIKVMNHQPKSPRSPAASLPRSPIKSPIRKSISIEEPIIKEEIEEVKLEVPPPPPPPVVSPVKECVMEERLPEVKEVIKLMILYQVL